MSTVAPPKFNVEQAYKSFIQNIESMISKKAELKFQAEIDRYPELDKNIKSTIKLYIEHFFSSKSEADVQFQLSKFPEVLLALVKLTQYLEISSPTSCFIGYDLFQKLFVGYINHPTDYTSEIQLEQRLQAFLRSRDKTFFDICSKHLLYTAARNSLYEVFEYLPNMRDLMQQGLIFPTSEFSVLGRSRVTTYCQTTTLLTQIGCGIDVSDERMEVTCRYLLNTGANIFKCRKVWDKHGKSDPSVISSDPKMMTYSLSCLDVSKSAKRSRLSSEVLIHFLENGAGCLNKTSRLLRAITAVDVNRWAHLDRDLIFDDNIDYHTSYGLYIELFKIPKNKLGIDPKELYRHLVSAELVFKVPGVNRYIFDGKEFGEYVQKFATLSPPEQIVLRRMCHSFFCLSQDERTLLCSSASESITRLFEKLKEEFARRVSAKLIEDGLTGTHHTGVHPLVFSYFAERDFCLTQDLFSNNVALGNNSVNGLSPDNDSVRKFCSKANFRFLF